MTGRQPDGLAHGGLRLGEPPGRIVRRAGLDAGLGRVGRILGQFGASLVCLKLT